MPYCPKCDMEFVDGITKCTDCGGPLYESKEVADELMRKAAEAQNAQMRAYYEKMMKEQQLAQQQAQQSPEVAAAIAAAQRRQAPTKSYVNKEQRYQDMSSSATAFYIMGAACTVGLAGIALGIIQIPFVPIMKAIIMVMLAAMAVGSFMVARSSTKSAKELKGQVAGEEQRTEEIIQWFLEKQTGKDIDRQILNRERGLGEEEMTLRRYDLIQDFLITGQDLPDQSYVDMLCEEIYTRLYEK